MKDNSHTLRDKFPKVELSTRYRTYHILFSGLLLLICCLFNNNITQADMLTIHRLPVFIEYDLLSLLLGVADVIENAIELYSEPISPEELTL